MQIGELIDHVRVVYLDDDSAQVEGDPDYLFGNETIVRLFNEAQRQLCRRAYVLVDNEESAIATIDLDSPIDYTGLRSVPYDSKIIRVMKVRFSDSDLPLLTSVAKFTDPPPYGSLPDPNYFNVNQPYTFTSGRPGKYALDSSTRYILFDRPLDADTAALDLKLRVARYPLVDLSDDLDQEPEVPEDFHLGLCEYVAWKLFASPNIEAANTAAMRQAKQNWEEVVLEARRSTFQRMQHQPGWIFGAWAQHSRWPGNGG